MAAGLLWACAHTRPTPIDPTLPEPTVLVDAQAPDALLREALSHDDPSVRARAVAWWLRAHEDPLEAAPAALFDPSPWVQHAALDGLLARPTVSEALWATVRAAAVAGHVDPVVRARAALALPGAPLVALPWAEASEPWVRGPLALPAASRGDAAARGALVASLATGELPADPVWFTLLAKHADASALPALAAAQPLADDTIALPLAVARLRLGDASAEGPLRKATGGPVESRLELVELLTEPHGPSAEALLARAQSAGPDLVRRQVALLLDAHAGRAEQLAAAQASDDPELRRFVVRCAAISLRLATTKAAVREAHEALTRALSDPDIAVRATAARHLGEARLTAPLEPLLRDESPWVRVEAAGALLALAD